MTTIRTIGGRTRRLPDHVDLDGVRGLDPEGRIVVDPFPGHLQPPEYLFALTLCCDAYDKGSMGAVVCRACYGAAPDADIGDYLFRRDDGTYPGLDPVEEVTTDD